MNTINQYKNRFYNLLESTMGDVRPLITENTVSGTPEFNQIVKNLGLELKGDESGGIIKNGNQLFGGNGRKYTFDFDSETKQGKIYVVEIDSKLPNNQFKDGTGAFFDIEYINNTTNLETIKTIVQNVINGKLDKNLLHKGDGNFPKFYEFYENNSLEGYDAYLSYLIIDLEGGNQIKNIRPSLYFISKNPDNRVKSFVVTSDGLVVSYGGANFKKEYVLDGSKISFEKDRKSTKGTARYKFDSLYDLADTDKYVKRGMKGEIVKQIQHKLLKSGQLKNTYKLAADNQKCMDNYQFCHGTFGEKTYAAVMEFQDANDLVVDGMVGPDTAEALRNV